MTEGGFLLALPIQSVLVRLVVGALVASLMVRLLLRSGMRVPGARVFAALLPALTAVAVVVVSFTALRLPTLAIPSAVEGSILVPLENSYTFLAPMAVPLLFGTWLVMVLARVTWRLWHLWRSERHASAAVADAPPPLHVRSVVRRVAARMGMDAPAVGMATDCPGGATVVGIRHPVVVVDEGLVDRLDAEELEAILAHELAHVRRRDNLVALLWGLIRDVAVFLPGGRWALQQLLVERELVADEIAVEVTNRPGALASGLLKVIEGPTTVACAAFAPSGTIVRRVEHLVDDRPAPGRSRRLTELLTVAVGLVGVVVAATAVPRMAAGTSGEGGLGVMVSPPEGNAEIEVVPDPYEAAIFSTYRHSVLAPQAGIPSPSVRLDDDPREVRRTTLRACAVDRAVCEPPAFVPSLGLRPPPDVREDPALQARLRARPLIGTDNVRIFWLSGMS